MADSFEARFGIGYWPLVELRETTKSSSALNLSTLNHTCCKFIRVYRSRLGIVRVPLGDRQPFWRGQSRNFERNERTGLRPSSARSIWSFAPSFPRGLGMPEVAFCPPLRTEGAGPVRFYFLSVGEHRTARSAARSIHSRPQPLAGARMRPPHLTARSETQQV